ncbi:hypothetical protein GCM10023232_06990 [Sphingosinicella ginsenosidimutans]
MATLKLTKRSVEAAVAGACDYELRDTEAPGFLCKVTPGGRKVFMLQYRTIGGERRKPAIGLWGELTVEQARTIAQKWLAVVREGGDPSLEKAKARGNPTVRTLCDEFITRHSIPNNKPSTVRSNRSYIRVHIKPRLGKLKVEAITRTDIADMMRDMVHIPGAANKVLACLKKMFNCAELWGHRRDGTNPCRLVPKYPEGRRTRLIRNVELAKLFDYLDRAEAEAWSIRPTFSPSGSSSRSRRACPRSPASNGTGSTSTSGAWSGPTVRPAASPSRSARKPTTCSGTRRAFMTRPMSCPQSPIRSGG